MDLHQLQQLLENPHRITTLSTVGHTGSPNAAIFGSTQLCDGEIIIGVGNNRSLQNLQQNPLATLMIVIPGDSILAFKGARVYLKCRAIEDSGELLEKLRAEATQKAGPAAARMLRYLLRFDILDHRALVDISSISSD